MIVLLDAAGASVTFAAVWFVWQARRAWLYRQRSQRVIRGQVEPPGKCTERPPTDMQHMPEVRRWKHEEPRPHSAKGGELY